METLATLTRQQLKDIWLQKSWRDDETFHLYLHNPFCLTQCSFCKHQGMKTKIGSDIYNKYYLEYLPGLIADFSEVIESRPVNSVYFGGGTSSMMTANIMTSVFKAVPQFSSIPHKTFECSPSLMNEEKIDILAKHGFTYVSFGVQTLDSRILIANNRPVISLERLKHLARRVQGHGMILNCDLITFIDKKDRGDLHQLGTDLDTLASEICPDVVTVYPETFLLRTSSPSEQLMLVGSLQLALTKFESRTAGRYSVSETNKGLFFSVEAIRDFLTRDYRIYKSSISSEGLRAVRSYNCSGGARVPPAQNTLGFGSLFGERDPAYSYMGQSFYCIEVNRSWTAEYHVKRDTNNLARVAPEGMNLDRDGLLSAVNHIDTAHRR